MLIIIDTSSKVWLKSKYVFLVVYQRCFDRSLWPPVWLLLNILKHFVDVLVLVRYKHFRTASFPVKTGSKHVRDKLMLFPCWNDVQAKNRGWEVVCDWFFSHRFSLILRIRAKIIPPLPTFAWELIGEPLRMPRFGFISKVHLHHAKINENLW